MVEASILGSNRPIGRPTQYRPAESAIHTRAFLSFTLVRECPDPGLAEMASLVARLNDQQSLTQ